jgi:hypothetical protein
MLGCEIMAPDEKSVRPALVTLLSGYRNTELELTVHDALQQRKGISQTVHFRSPAFLKFIWWTIHS